MSKQPIISDVQLVEGAEKFFYEECEGNLKKFTNLKLAEYLSANYGLDIKEHHINRRDVLKEFVSNIKRNKTKIKMTQNIVYKTLNVDEFLYKNNTSTKLRKALLDLDMKYEAISKAANESIHKEVELNSKINTLMKENAQLKDKIKLLETENDKLKEHRNNYVTENIGLKETVQYLKSLFEEMVYPEVAESLLKDIKFSEDDESSVLKDFKLMIQDDLSSVTEVMKIDEDTKNVSKLDALSKYLKVE